MTISRRIFSLSLLPLAALPAIGTPPLVRSIRLRDIEHPYDPQSGDAGRGMLVTPDELVALDTTGYGPFTVPGSNQNTFLCYGPSGAPNYFYWRGYMRREGDRYFVAAVEFHFKPKRT